MPEVCFGCGGSFVPSDGPVHDVMASTPGCWAAYGELLAREYADQALFKACHRLTVDAYAVQHVGAEATVRARRPFWLHLASLHAVLELGHTEAEGRALMGRLAKSALPAGTLDVPAFRSTHADVLARTERDHASAVSDWAESVYEDWRPTIPSLRRWIGQAGEN